MSVLLAAQLALIPVATAEEHLVLDAAVSGVHADGADSGAAPGLSLGARADLMRFHAGIEGQAVSSDYWTGRVSGGLDLLHRVEAVDLEVGLFSGAGGGIAAPTIAVAPLAGVELGLGLHMGRVGLSARHSFELASQWEEDRLRLSVDVFERARVFGQYTRLTPGDDAEPRDGVGVGLSLVF